MIQLKREANLLTITSLVAFQSLAHLPAFANPDTRAMMVTDDDHANVHAEMVDSMRFNSPISLDEVVVTGQGGAIERRRLSSNVTKISGKDLQKLTVGRMDEMLRNAIPGVQFSLSGAQPGSTSVIKARGLSSAFSNSTPIIYIDGVRTDNLNTGAILNYSKKGYGAQPYTIGDMPMGEMAASSALSDISMENIDHIEYVSGGAATTLYGSDAANGVIQIFTKKGSSDGFHASASVDMGWDKATTQFYHFRRTADLLNQTGFEQRYRLSLAGGNSKYGYSLGANMMENTGVVIHNNNAHKRYDLRFGSRAQLTTQLEYQNSFGFVAEDYNRSRNGNQGFYTGLWFTEGSASSRFKFTDAKGHEQRYPADIDAADGDTFEKMRAFVDKAEALQHYRESTKHFQTSHTLLYKPLPQLTVKGVFGIDYRANNNKEIVTNEYLIHIGEKHVGTTDAGRVNNFDRNYFGLTADINGQYKFYHANRLSNVLTAGFQYFNTHDRQAIYRGTNVRDGAKVMSGAGTVQADEWLNFLHSYGFYAQDNIGLFNKYYVDLGARVDYNTAFGDNVKWQFYPKLGLSYVMSDEPFLASLVSSGMLSMLRVFCNYGVAGSYPPPFAYQRTISVTGYQGKQAGTFGQFGNPDLGPEKKHSFEVGFESSFLHDVATLSFTYYHSVTKGALFTVPTLPSAGRAASYLANIGEISNLGVEMALALNVVRTKDWQATLRTAVNTNRNRVLSAGGTVPFSIGGFGPETIQTAVEEGKPVGFLRGNKAVLNADGTLKEVLRMQDLGSTIPTCYGNVSLDVHYKNCSLWMSSDYQTGSYVHSFDRQFRFQKGLKDDVVPQTALMGRKQKDAWLDFTNYFVEKADFFKVRNVGLSYLYHLKGSKPVVKSVLFSMSVNNPLNFTAASVDPEAVISGAHSQGAVASGGLNYATYSLPRQYIFSLKFNL
jgi:hypothetical protein